jgi:hypothetical protein
MRHNSKVSGNTISMVDFPNLMVNITNIKFKAGSGLND